MLLIGDASADEDDHCCRTDLKPFQLSANAIRTIAIAVAFVVEMLPTRLTVNCYYPAMMVIVWNFETHAVAYREFCALTCVA